MQNLLLTQLSKRFTPILLLLSALCLIFFSTSCVSNHKHNDKTAADILGNPLYQAVSYGGYRQNTRDIQPTLAQLKEDMKIMEAMGIKILRTYNVHLPEASNILEAIHQLKEEDADFEMYVMLGVWIDCKNAWTDQPERIRDQNSERNAHEIDQAVELAKQYPDIVKIIAVGNEAMVKWAWNYYVEPGIILQWVNHLQQLKQSGALPKDLWITSSDNFASWGGGSSDYHVDDLNKLMAAVDYISVHTYPMHDTHYNPDFWYAGEEEAGMTDDEKIEAAMKRSLAYAKTQYQSVVDYMHSLKIEKPVHIGETGWASRSDGFYGNEGSRATDEYKSAMYYHMVRDWTNQAGISCFYFEAFDEQWKDAANPLGSENHFGLINLESQAKYALWEMVDSGVFEGLTRDGKAITKTYNGDLNALMEDVRVPPTAIETKIQNE